MTKAYLQLCRKGNEPIVRLIEKKGGRYFQVASGAWEAFKEDEWIDIMELDLKDNADSIFQRLKPDTFSLGTSGFSISWNLGKQKAEKKEKTAKSQELISIMKSISNTKKSEHDKRIVLEVEATWNNSLSDPKSILSLTIENSEMIKVPTNPFVTSPQIAYFESHLETGYSDLWKKIRTWKNSRKKLFDKTSLLANKTLITLKEYDMLPKYDKRQSDQESIHYQHLVECIFSEMLADLNNWRDFNVEVDKVMKAGSFLYRLGFNDNWNPANSSDEKKILKLKEKVENFVKDKSILKEFKDIFEMERNLNMQLKDFLVSLERIYTEVNNDIPLKGICEIEEKWTNNE